MSKPFKSWVRLAIVVSLSIFTPFNSAYAGRWMERWMHRPSCKASPACEVVTAVAGIDGCNPCTNEENLNASPNACCGSGPEVRAGEGSVSDSKVNDSKVQVPAAPAPNPAPEKSVPWTRIEPSLAIEPSLPVEPLLPEEEPSIGKPDVEPEADENKSRDAREKLDAPEPAVPAPVEPSEPEPSEALELEEAVGRDSDANDLVEPDMDEDSVLGEKEEENDPPARGRSDAGNGLESPKGKPIGSFSPAAKGSNEATEKKGGTFRLNEGDTKKARGAGIEDELDRIFRSKTFVPPAKFQGAEFRAWTDNTGAYSIEARVAVIFGDKVRLLKENGKYTTVPMDRLSDFDKSYVQWVAESLTYRASKIVRNNNADETSTELAR